MSHHTQLMTRGLGGGGGRPREDSIWSNCSSDSWLRTAADTTHVINSTISTTQHNANASAPSPNTTTSSNNFDLKLFIKDVHDKHGRKRPLAVKPWASIKDVKDLLANHLHVPPSSQRLYFGPLLTSARELPNHRTLMDAGIYRNGETLLLEITRGNNVMLGGSSSGLSSSVQDSHSISSLRTKANDVCVSSSLLDLTPKSLQRLVQQARRGLALGFKPALAPDGSGGSYFLCDARKKRVGVFKPADEEPFSENNPRGYVPHDCSNEGSGGGGGGVEDDAPTESLRQGIRPGELCLREVAAFILDHDGFSDVPMTTLAEAQHPALHVNGANWTLSEGGASVGVHSISSPLSSTNLMASASTGGTGISSSGDLVKKVGSFQEYVYSECSMDDLSPSKISVEEVHKIAILDIRIMNADRNVANIMCQRIPEDPDHFRLIPIDHGYSLRSVCDVAWFDWCWLDWPQTKVPLGKKARDYVLNLDIDEDVRLLKERLGMGDDVLDYYRVSCMILKSGVKAGLTLYEIASGILCRTDPSGEIPSKLETLTSVAGELATSAVHNGRFHHATASLALEEQLSTTKKAVDRRSSVFPSPYSKPRPVVRSASSSVFSQVPSMGGESAFTDELFRGSSNLSGEDLSTPFDSRASSMNTNPPEVVQSSQSDDNSFDSASCSFASGPDDVEADEWAADMIAIADQNMDIKENGLFGRNRSTSESSSSSSESNSSSNSSKSPVGFWTVRPGSSFDDRSTDEDDDSICWAPALSHNPITSSKDTNLLSPHAFSSSNLVKFVEETKTSSPEEDSNNADDEFGPITPPTQVTSFSAFKPLQKTMYRSHSYAAFSSYPTGDFDRRPTMFQSTLCQSTNVRARGSLSSTQEKDLFRTYFMKFVDLLIVRETERLIHNRADE
mmetsp:Transcript_139/g.180  ORF Transcript_139/g.180 Transcript_139/m.180 type:complete len:902 (+) Transcript_139:616-3321(+)